ncbi:MAG: hypothetical protein NTW07_06295 [candidate division Zixibacteria bacterium]|nr:hypothetical protein [candidate division Zixibacteria bacterium]
MRHKLKLVLVLVLCAWTTAVAQTDTALVGAVDAAPALPPPLPVTDLQAFDTDNDHGHAITLTWEKSADDGAGRNSVLSYEIFRWFPFQMDVVDALRKSVSETRDAVRAFRIDMPRAELALRELREDPGKLSTIRFSVAQPHDSTFQLTVDYAIRALEDTLAFMREHAPILKNRIKPLQQDFEKALASLPQAYASYPGNGEWRSLGKALVGSTTYTNTGSKETTTEGFFPDYADLYYRVEAVTVDESIRSEAATVGPVQSRGQWFHTGKVPVLGFVLMFFIFTLTFVQMAKKGADLYVRPLSGIEAVDDAIGRATEMGRPILYLLGIGTATEVATIASFSILGRVSKRVAEYQTPIIVPCYDPIVMAVAQEVVKSSYMDAARADDYRQESVFFVTNYQFAYVAAVNGIMLRERPATNVYMGKFMAESLLLAETGTLAGSIQIAGTDEIAQIPFFIVACDYTLIGEELYAASAYLGREPVLLGSLKAQDLAKALVMLVALIGMLCTAFGWPAFAQMFQVTG